MSARLTATRRAILQAAANCGPSELFQPPLNSMPAVGWLREEGLLGKHSGLGYRATALGEEALRQPFGSQAEAHAAVDGWKELNPMRRRFVIGWVALRCKGGGWAVRIGFRSRDSVLLPDGLAKELLR